MLCIIRKCVSGVLSILFALSVALCSGELSAQSTISSTRVSTEPSGAQFYVDGQLYERPALFLWPAGSKHVLSVYPNQQKPLTKTRYTFTSWTDSRGLLSASGATVTVTADPGITSYIAAVKVEHAVSLNFFSCADPDPLACGGSPGTVSLNGTPYSSNAEVYLTSDSTVVLQAVPNPGFVFTGWLPGLGNSSQAYLNTFVLNAPTVVYPRFILAGQVGVSTPNAGQISILTSPPGLQVTVDRGSVATPVTLEWGLGTAHTLGVISPQTDRQGIVWNFEAWSDGKPAAHTFTMPDNGTPQTVTARFVMSARATFLTDPPGLSLTIDGRDNWPAYSFSWGAGSTHSVSAPLRQVDSAGRAYAFQGWSNGGPAAQQITYTSEDVASGYRLTAIYRPLGKITIQASPAALAVRVNGEECQTPCRVEPEIGVQLRISAPPSVAVTEGSRLDFARWSNASGPEQTVTAGVEPQTLTAIYNSRNRLLLTTDPPDGAILRAEPSSADGFYDSETQVAFTLEPKAGYKFRAWEGDLAGTSRSGTVNLNVPRSIRALLDRVPGIRPGGVRNAAGETPQSSVARGSVVSIFGFSLAPRFEPGPANPLAQTIASVTVRSAGKLLPLLFVSPEQINAQLPSSLEEGDQSLTVRWEGKPEVTASFSVERNAPGLFFSQVGGRALGAIIHEDGLPVSMESPARRNEVVTLLGTGFGPYQRELPDGFAAPQSMDLRLADPLTVLVGDTVIQPIYAGAAAVHAGLAAVRFRVSDPLPRASTVELKVQINGKESNTVLLPLE